MAKAVRTQAVPWLKSSAFHCGGSGSFPCVNEGFVADKVALGQIFSEHFSFMLSLPFHQCHIHIHSHVSLGSDSVIKQEHI
jgi:hypothetical protein